MDNRHFRQAQFLSVKQRDEAERLFSAAIDCAPRGVETVDLNVALGRVLAKEVFAPIDVPGFDRSNVDGYALQSVQTAGAREDAPRQLRIQPGIIEPGQVSETPLADGHASAIATGAVVPRGADAVIMVEHTEVLDGELSVLRSVPPGNAIAFAGSDIALGEVVLRANVVLTSRETGVLAALGLEEVSVFKRPKVAVISTGNELIEPGEDYKAGKIYDSNSRILADAIRESGGEPHEFGISEDDADGLSKIIRQALAETDIVVLSGGTSKGSGDLSYRVVSELTSPGIIAHGVALKPGKPICLAAHERKPVVILPGFPTSAIFTFHEFVAPVIRAMAGRLPDSPSSVTATLPVRVNSEVGRTEYLLVGLVQATGPASNSAEHVAFPLGKGSGSVTSFSHADGFIKIDHDKEILEQGEQVRVQLIGNNLQTAQLVVVGSHCPGLDRLLSHLQTDGFRTKFLAVGSSAGLQAVERGECDLAGIHLLDPVTGKYNVPFATPSLEFLRGYAREQGVVFRKQEPHFEGKSGEELIEMCARETELRADANIRMVNRNAGSGTRMLIDQHLKGAQPAGYSVQVTSHNAVAAAVAQRRADWGVAIRAVAEAYDLAFAPLGWEQFDFIVPKSRVDNPAIARLQELLQDDNIRAELMALGFAFDQN